MKLNMARTSLMASCVVALLAGCNGAPQGVVQGPDQSTRTIKPNDVTSPTIVVRNHSISTIAKITQSDTGCPWTVNGNGGTFPSSVPAMSHSTGVTVTYNTTCSPVSSDIFSVQYGTAGSDPDTWCLFDITYTGAPQFTFSVSGGNQTNCLVGQNFGDRFFDYATLPSGMKSHHKH